MTARILVVDDEPDLDALIQQKFRHQISDGAVSFLFASDGIEAFLNVELSLPIFRLALAVFIPWRGAAGFRPAPGMAPALMVCWIEGGAGNILFSVLPGGAVEPLDLILGEQTN